MTILLLFVCMCAFCIARLPMSTVWFYFVLTFFESGYVLLGKLDLCDLGEDDSPDIPIADERMLD